MIWSPSGACTVVLHHLGEVDSGLADLASLKVLATVEGNLYRGDVWEESVARDLDALAVNAALQVEHEAICRGAIATPDEVGPIRRVTGPSAMNTY